MSEINIRLYRKGERDSDEATYMTTRFTQLTLEQQKRVNHEFVKEYRQRTEEEYDEVDKIVRTYRGKEKDLLKIIKGILGE